MNDLAAFPILTSVWKTLKHEKRILRKQFLSGKILLYYYSFLGHFSVLNSKLLHLPPLRLYCVAGYWDQTRGSCDFSIGLSVTLTAGLDLIYCILCNGGQHYVPFRWLLISNKMCDSTLCTCGGVGGDRCIMLIMILDPGDKH